MAKNIKKHGFWLTAEAISSSLPSLHDNIYRRFVLKTINRRKGLEAESAAKIESYLTTLESSERVREVFLAVNYNEYQKIE